MMDVLTTTANLLKNENDQWPHQFMTPGGMMLFSLPAIAGFIEGGLAAGLLFGLPLITIILIQRFFPI